MKIGCCGSWKEVHLYAELGFDYIEPAVEQVIDDNSFQQLVEQTSKYGLKAEAFNCLLPASLPVVGPDVDLEAVRKYLEKAFPRIASLGGEIVVFGSGRARKIPPEYPQAAAEKQILDFLELAAEVADANKLKVVIEPLNKKQTNTMNNVADARKVCAQVKWRVGLLADLFHVTAENEPFTNLEPVGELSHIHIPFPEEAFDTETFIGILKSHGYDKRISLEDNGGLRARTAPEEWGQVLADTLRYLREVR